MHWEVFASESHRERSLSEYMFTLMTHWWAEPGSDIAVLCYLCCTVAHTTGASISVSAEGSSCVSMSCRNAQSDGTIRVSGAFVFGWAVAIMSASHQAADTSNIIQAVDV